MTVLSGFLKLLCDATRGISLHEFEAPDLESINMSYHKNSQFYLQ